MKSNFSSRAWRIIPIACIVAAAFLLPGELRAADVTLAWNPSPDVAVTGYRLHYGNASGAYSAKVETGSATSCKVSGLTAGLTYYFAATAVNSSGIESAYSNQVSWSAPAADTQPPAAPAQLKAAAQASGANLTWSANTEPDLAGYRVYYGTASGSYGSSIDAKKVTVYSVTGLDAGKTYYFALKAYDAAGNLSAYSNQASCAIPVPDSDGDGFIDTQDALPNDPTEWKDSDRDGLGDNADPDDNNDGVPDAQANRPPIPPAPVSPAEDEIVGTTPVLKIGPFADPDAGDEHAETRWQIFREPDGLCILDIQTEDALTALTVPKLALKEGASYFWRARVIDLAGAASEWSSYGYFSTQKTNADMNRNGTPDDQEVSTRLDLDGNGVKDVVQTDLKAVVMEGTTVKIGVSRAGCAAIKAIEAVESEKPGVPGGYASAKPANMPFGLINFKLIMAKPGDQAVVTLYFSTRAPLGSLWYKYDSVSGKWYDFSGSYKFLNRRKAVQLTIKDGGFGDADGVANGIIVDPAGLFRPEKVQ